jgi:hypothetical protein
MLPADLLFSLLVSAYSLGAAHREPIAPPPVAQLGGRTARPFPSPSPADMESQA